ncbi:hypothetical protein AVEN_36735-1 [Araneus ventricosus]|uniref:Uncharacterized protein n=1 Tax=Araneus ventricosus TaxID=182803 RepID=A0A4Y2EBV9_ARAVE|nr:hypothetical protein AVEN_36735-1 [Araneus ventricosus]
MTRTLPVLVPYSPSFHTTPTGGNLIPTRFGVPQVHKHSESSVESGFEHGPLRLQSKELTTKPSIRIFLSIHPNISKSLQEQKFYFLDQRDGE